MYMHIYTYMVMHMNWLYTHTHIYLHMQCLYIHIHIYMHIFINIPSVYIVLHICAWCNKQSRDDKKYSYLFMSISIYRRKHTCMLLYIH